jgi:hypothetical protein
MRRAKAERQVAYWTCVDQLGVAWAQARLTQPLVITLTRIAPRRMDPDDGLRSSLKHIKDGIADYLCCLPGHGHRYDDNPRFTWQYAQRRGDRPRQYAVAIGLE